jgi:hypothetical protein
MTAKPAYFRTLRANFSIADILAQIAPGRDDGTVVTVPSTKTTKDTKGNNEHFVFVESSCSS